MRVSSFLYSLLFNARTQKTIYKCKALFVNAPTGRRLTGPRDQGLNAGKQAGTVHGAFSRFRLPGSEANSAAYMIIHSPKNE